MLACVLMRPNAHPATSPARWVANEQLASKRRSRLSDGACSASSSGQRTQQGQGDHLSLWQALRWAAWPSLPLQLLACILCWLATGRTVQLQPWHLDGPGFYGDGVCRALPWDDVLSDSDDEMFSGARGDYPPPRQRRRMQEEREKEEREQEEREKEEREQAQRDHELELQGQQQQQQQKQQQQQQQQAAEQLPAPATGMAPPYPPICMILLWPTGAAEGWLLLAAQLVCPALTSYSQCI